MATKLDLNQFPHFDDYKESDKYYQILFRPGRSVQARELTQLQTMLQRQIERFGKHIFKNGSNVLPGTDAAVRYTPGITFIKLPLEQVVPTYNQNTTTPDEIEAAIKEIWIGSTIETSAAGGLDRQGIKGTILGFRGPDKIGTYGEVRFFLNIVSSSDNGKYSKFQPGDSIVLSDGQRAGLQASIPSITAGSDQLKVGTVSSVTVEEGVYFYNGYFVYVDGQTLFLSPIDSTGQYDSDSQEMQGKWSDLPTCSVGLVVTEQIKTFQDDAALLDNALGTPNYTAPGADRLHISADLGQILYDATQTKPDNFITQLEVSKGVVYSLIDAPEYGPILDTLARRTYDESGDYVVENLSVQITDFLRDDVTKNNGAHSISEFQFTTQAAAAACAEKVFGLTTGTKSFKHLASSGGDDYWYPGTSYDNRNDLTSFKSLCDSFLTARVDPGKAYVKGYEIRKLAKSNIDIPKSRTARFASQATIFTPLGRYFTITDVAGNTAFTNFVEVDLYDARRQGTQVAPTAAGAPYTYKFSTSLTPPSYATKIGTAKIVKVDVDVESGAGFYTAYITDVSMLNGAPISAVKLIYSAAQKFIAHPVLSTYELTGSITFSGTPSATSISALGNAAAGWFSVPGEILKQNDYLYLESTQEFYRVTATPGNNGNLSLALDTASGTVATVPATGSKFSGTYSRLEFTTNDSGLLYQLPESYIKTVRTQNVSDGSPATATSMSYTVDRVFDNSGAGIDVAAGSQLIELDVSTTTDEFESNIFRYKVIRKTKSSGEKVSLVVTSGNAAPSVDTDVIVQQTSTSGQKLQKLTFYFSEANSASATYSYTIVVPVTKIGVAEKKKTLKYGSFDSSTNVYVHEGNGSSFVPSDANEGAGVKVVDASNNSEIYLGNSTNNICDVYRITRIVASKDAETVPSRTSTLNEGDTDVTALYLFDSGQTEYYYGFAKVYLRPNYPKPSGQVRVEYDYFVHSGNSDYFSVDSYVHPDGIVYEEVPFFKSSGSASYSLADTLDFRKPITDSTSGAAPIDYLTCDYFAYNGRNDKIVLNSKTKKFELLSGTPSGEPNTPDDDSYGMTLVELVQNPYGIGKDSCRMKLRDNRRYTMRDIGKLEKRIENLEYYTSLSLLEQETSRMRITDANGNDRFKNGFLTDSFTSFESSDIDSFDFSCSIDTGVEHVARPLVSTDQFKLVEDISNQAFQDTAPALRATAGLAYTRVGDLFLLPYTRTGFISQKLASKVVNVNPYNVFTYVGSINLTPWSDTWKETRYTEINIYDDGAYQQARSMVTGQIDYTKTYNLVSNINIGKVKKTGRYKLLVAGHMIIESLSPKERQEVLRKKKYRVPDGYVNAGELIDIDTKGGIVRQAETRQTTTKTIKHIRMGLESDIKKTGVSTSRAITKDETSDIEFMRSRDVVISGASFRQNSNLYAYFDDIPVSNYCRPVDTVDVNNWISYTVTDISHTSASPVNALPVDSPSRYFKLVNAAEKFPVSRPAGSQEGEVGLVRPGCEVLVPQPNGIVRRFEVVSVIQDQSDGTGYTILRVQEKTQEGMIARDMAEIRPTSGTSAFTIKISKYTFGDQLKTSGNGSVKCVFRIPNDDGNRFKTGQVRFVLSTSSASSKSDSGISRATADFVSKGELNVQEVTITQTQNYTVSSHLVDESSSNTTNQDIYGLLPPEIKDPIAQTFRVRENGGCFITDVEVFFAKKASNTDIQLELRSVSATGQPESTIVGGTLGIVNKHAEDVVVNEVVIASPESGTANSSITVSIDAGTNASSLGGRKLDERDIVVWDNTTSIQPESGAVVQANQKATFVAMDLSKTMIPTRFTFAAPIFLEQGKSYCFVLLSDSVDYEVWVAQRGPYGPQDKNVAHGYYTTVGETNVKIGTGESLDNQELYVDGDFFKSKNGFGWQIDPSVSVKFNLGKAIFNTRADVAPNIPNTGEIAYVNESVGWIDVMDRGLEIRPNSDLIRVTSLNHGVSVGDSVRFVFDMETDADGTIRGFTKDALQTNRGLTVVQSELDFFTVRVAKTDAASESSWSVSAWPHLSRQHHRLGAYVTNDAGTKVPTVKMRISKKFDQLLVVSNTFCPKGTSVEYTLQTTPGNGVNEYNPDGSSVNRNPTKTKTSPSLITSGTPNEFASTMMLLSPECEKTALGPTFTRSQFQDSKSVILRARLISDNSNLSPVLDASRLAATTVTSRLDNPKGITSTEIGNVVNLTEDNFDKLTVIDKSFVPSDKILYAETKTFTTPQTVSSVTLDKAFNQILAVTLVDGSTTTKVTSGYTFVSPTITFTTPLSISNASGGVLKIETLNDVVREPLYTGTSISAELTFTAATNSFSGTFAEDSPNSKTLVFTPSAASGATLLGKVSSGDTIIDTATSEQRTVVKVVSGTKLVVNSPFNPPLSATARLEKMNSYMEITTNNSSVAAHLSQLDVGKYASLEIFVPATITETKNFAAGSTVTSITTNSSIASISTLTKTIGGVTTSISGAISGTDLKTVTFSSQTFTQAGQITIAYRPTVTSATSAAFSSVGSSDADYAKSFSNALIVGVDYTPDSSSVKCKIVVSHLNTGTTALASGKYVTISQWDKFVNEIAPDGGSAGSRYLCKKLNLDRASNALKISFDAIRDEYSEIDLYYRTEGANDISQVYDNNWKKAPYNIDVDGVLTLKAPEPSDSEFRSYESTIENLSEFTGVQAKVVLRGGNTAKPPKIKNFRLIALDE